MQKIRFLHISASEHKRFAENKFSANLCLRKRFAENLLSANLGHQSKGFAENVFSTNLGVQAQRI